MVRRAGLVYAAILMGGVGAPNFADEVIAIDAPLLVPAPPALSTAEEAPPAPATPAWRPAGSSNGVSSDGVLSVQDSLPTLPDLAPIPTSSESSLPGPIMGVPATPNPLPSGVTQAMPATVGSLQSSIGNSIAIDLMGPSSLSIHVNARYQIRVRNVGAETVRNIDIEAKIPEHLTVVRSEPKARQDGAKQIWRIDSLSAGGDRIFELDASAQRPSPATIDVSARIALDARLATNFHEPKLLVDTKGPAKIGVGERLNCSIELSNPGNGPVVNGGLQLSLTPGLQLAELSEIARRPYSLTPGQSISVPLSFDVRAKGPQKITIIAEADGGLKTKHEHLVAALAPELTVQLNGPKKRYAGRTTEYELIVENKGDVAAQKVFGFIEFPRSVRFVGADSKGTLPAGTFEPRQHMVYWSLGTMAPGSLMKLPVSLVPDKDGDIEIRGSAKDDRLADDETYLTTRIESRADVGFSVELNPMPAVVGETVVSSFRVVNRGAKASSDLKLTVARRDGFRLNASRSSGWKETATEWVWERIAGVSPDGEQSITLALIADKAGRYSISASLSGADLGGEITHAEPLQVDEE